MAHILMIEKGSVKKEIGHMVMVMVTFRDPVSIMYNTNSIVHHPEVQLQEVMVPLHQNTS